MVDELGAQSLRPWAADVLYDLINRRYARRLPTLFTTNYRLDDRRRGAPNRSPPTARSPASRAAGRETRRGRARDLQSAELLSRRIPGMLVSRLWEMAQVISLDAVKDFRMEVRSHQHWREGRPGGCCSGACWRSVATLGVAAIAAKSSDLAGAALPPPYRGAAGSIVVRVGLETDLASRRRCPAASRCGSSTAGRGARSTAASR